MPLSGWPALPTELRLQILDELEKQLSPASNHYVRAWASVSKEWRPYFEPLLWQTLHFRSSASESGFGGLREIMADHRRGLVRKISLHVDLASHHTCEGCDRPESEETKEANNARFSDAMGGLFRVLSSWPSHDDDDDDGPGGGIALELSASSPSDARHPSSSPEEHERRVGGRSRSPGHSLAGVEQQQRLLGRNGHLTFVWPSAGGTGLTPVPAVRSFAVSRKLCRAISPASMGHILDRLPNLHDVYYESGRGVGDRDLYNAVNVNTLMFEASRHPAVRRFSMWLASMHESDAPVWTSDASRTAVEAVWSGYRLRELAVSHAMEADHFFLSLRYFSALQGNTIEIEHLALTYSFRKLALDPAEAAYLLGKAAEAALQMPRIRILEVWAAGGAVGKGFFFRYQVKENQVKLTVGATWDVPLSHAVLLRWERVANRHHPALTLQSVSQRIDPAVLTTPESICTQLELYHLIRQW
ncbi:hypothetical protein CTA2_7818 [Colletotrichum tanaceti]|uniref:DUF6546 domain-containing protein n=1 Tax=Colletotrichum tanaceti TaxID=1306861 RepID=A0A4U6XHR1_9PEZI|nr:hypothetical protein CTA2_7818 [Colletotrichum tanaceti]TKW54852.1 hypothetical protein CTA1_3952 [Colletotrichum tanaceti]